MNSEEILKNFAKIEREVKENPPNIWIRFSVFKKQVEKSLIPETAETTAKKVFLYINVANGDVQFDTGGEPYGDLERWYSSTAAYAQASKDKDYILISHWEVQNLYKIIEQNFSGPFPWKTKYVAKHIFSLIVNNNKDLILRPATTDYDPTKFWWKIARKPIITRQAEDYVALRNMWNWGTLSKRTININQAFAEVFGIGLIGGNKYIMFDDVTMFGKFLTYKDPVIRETPKQKLINELVAIPLKDPTVKFDPNAKNKLVCVAAKVNSEYSVLRWYMETAAKTAYEISRLYVTKKTHIFCRKNNSGEYVVLNNKLSSTAFDSQEVIIQDTDAFAGTKLEYFEEIYKSLKPEQRGAALYTLTVFPEFEKMYKAGMKNICMEYINLPYGTSWATFLSNEFGKTNPKEKSLTKMLGFNKYQLDKLNANRKTEQHGWYYCGLGSEIKKVMHVDDCSSIDNKAFDAVLDMLVNYPRDWYIVRALESTVDVYSLKVCVNMIPTLKKLGTETKSVEVATRWGGTYTSTMSVMQLYADYVDMVGQLGESARMRPHFDSFDDIKRMHDAAVVVLNLKRDAIELSKFNKRIDVWKKWEFDDDEKYEVIAPTKPEDIANEGITLHHCVKTYIGRVSVGSTNIMFIREKAKRNTPFFTVEVGNKGTIEQIHGFGNRNVDTEPGLEKFVKKWAKERKLKAAGYNKIR